MRGIFIFVLMCQIGLANESNSAVQKAAIQHYEKVIKPALTKADPSDPHYKSEFTFETDENKAIEILKNFHPAIPVRAATEKWKSMHEDILKMEKLSDSDLASELDKAKRKETALSNVKPDETAETKLHHGVGAAFDMKHFTSALLNGMSQNKWSAKTRQLATDVYFNALFALSENSEDELLAVAMAGSLMREYCEIFKTDTQRCQYLNQGSNKIKALHQKWKEQSATLDFESTTSARKYIAFIKAEHSEVSKLKLEVLDLLKQARSVK
jgi:hypothetical protein